MPAALFPWEEEPRKSFTTGTLTRFVLECIQKWNYFAAISWKYFFLSRSSSRFGKLPETAGALEPAVQEKALKSIHLPAINRRYWTLISLASIVGANLGDFLADVLHLGNLTGLPWLIAAFLLLLGCEFADRRSRSDLYYWLGVIVVRAAATNLGDYFQRDLHLSKPAMIAGLILLLAVVLLLGRKSKQFFTFYQPQSNRQCYPGVDARYWMAMLMAGTLGTVLGDYLSYGGYHLGNSCSSAILSAALAGVLLLGRHGLLTCIPYYWFAVVAVRSAGTAVGDMLADPDKFHMGLELSTALSTLIYLLLAIFWRNQSWPQHRQDKNQ